MAVPEQVNIPLKICAERGIFSEFGLDVEHVEVKEGTGKMLRSLEESTADVALVVTDALLVAQSNGVPVEMVGTYVSSPLVWSVLGHKPLAHFTENDKTSPIKIGVSRIGSGSQTMAQFLAFNQGWDSERLVFVVADTFEGLRRGLTAGNFDYFMWELFTTKPWVDRGEIFKIADVDTPWTAFSFAARKDRETDLSNNIRTKLFPAIRKGVNIFMENDSGESLRRIVQEYRHSQEDAALWFSKVQYAAVNLMDDKNFSSDRKATESSIKILKNAGLIKSKFSIP